MPGGLHLELDERQRAVVEHDDLHRQLVLAQGEQLAEQHRQAAVAGERDDLPARVGGLRADRLRQRVGHAAVVERADQPAPAVHGAGSARPRCTGVPTSGVKTASSRGEPVDRRRDVLRVDRPASPAGVGQRVEPAAGPAVVGGHPVQVRCVGLGRRAAAAARRPCP